MSNRPTAAELATAVREFLEAEILPTLDDQRLRFRTLVAMNALSIVERESPAPGEADWTMARRICAGDIRETDLAELKLEVAARLAIASPKFLGRYRSADETDR
ncbi:hypothetical protein [Gaiella sp.]|uniref:hypothetical protein n=1 Tax=Gaiella sp. TaxID=2663207 RepID=UPI0032646F26